MRLPQVVTVAQLDLFDEVIDVRSPSEYAEDHVPGAISCPVLDDAERAEVGTLYKQVSPFAARKRGAALVARNIARHVEQVFGDRPQDWRPLVYCWRGGKRSGAMAHVLREIGWQAAQLDGGYKAYRRHVVSQLEVLPTEYDFIVICGETGSAKSRLLTALAVQGAATLDLEQIARHRGSVLGGLPESPQPSQKGFETRVWDALRRLPTDQPVFVEAESKKIGELQVPEQLLQRIRGSRCIRIEASVAERVRFLTEEYRHFLDDPATLYEKLGHLAALHGKETIARWQDFARTRQWERLVADLLESHYDPAYRRSSARNFAHFTDAPAIVLASLAPEALDAAAARIVREASVASPAAA